MMSIPRHRLCYLLLLLFLGTTCGTWAMRVQPSNPGMYTLHGHDSYRVTSLPGYGHLKQETFSGYINVDEKADRNLFFTFVASENKNSQKIVLWLNGGPGCSSIGGGFLSELGPFYAQGGAKLEENEFSWHKAASIIFLESPAFVGFSYSKRQEDAIVGDARTAKDTRTFLVNFFKEFEELRNHDLYISGESYGGHYVPQAAAEILKGNKKEPENALNLKGFFVGNALTVPEKDSSGAVEFWFTHGMISLSSYNGIMENCDFAEIYPLKSSGEMLEDMKESIHGEKRRKKCADFVDQAMEEFRGIYIYDIYVDVCQPKKHQVVRQLLQAFGESHYLYQALGREHGNRQSPYDPCIDNKVELYLNRKEVQIALHANTTGDIPGPWKSCTDNLYYSKQDVMESMIPLYEELLQSGIRILIYSGDIDAILPITGTRRWLDDLNLPIKSPWRPWKSSTGQVGGWTVEYSNQLTFASVRQSGHMVPYTQPERAFHMMSHWIQGKKL
eukprot:jgi/Picsp_1/5379/NSC_02740-R1_protein